jgi:hypothetical protein
MAHWKPDSARPPLAGGVDVNTIKLPLLQAGLKGTGTGTTMATGAALSRRPFTHVEPVASSRLEHKDPGWDGDEDAPQRIKSSEGYKQAHALLTELSKALRSRTLPKEWKAPWVHAPSVGQGLPNTTIPGTAAFVPPPGPPALPPLAVHGARFSAEIYPRGCHWFPRLLA